MKSTNTKATNVTESTKAINTKIEGIGRTSKKLEKDIQDCLIMILTHKATYGDWSGFIRLIDAIGGGTRKNSVRAWIEQVSNVRFPKGEKPSMDRNLQDMAVAEAKKISWIDADGVEKTYKSLDWNKQADRLLEKLQSDIDHGMASLQSLEILIAGLQNGLDKKQEIARKQAEEALALAA